MNAKLAFDDGIKVFEELAFDSNLTWLVIQENTDANIYVFCTTSYMQYAPQ
jgi:hypothetical protein